MDEIRQENHIYYFSKKVLFLSLIFLLINIAWAGIAVFQYKAGYFRAVAPKLVFSENSVVEVKTPFDDEFLRAKPGQTLFAGSYIKTGDDSYAEMHLEGNVMRMDSNTDVQFMENNFKSRALPRFVFKLNSGGLWVNAFDRIDVQTPRSRVSFSHSAGACVYSKPLNRIFSFTGSADVTLYNEKNEFLTEFVIPLKNQIVFADTQLIQDYARLEYSKLKKELKMGGIAEAVLMEDWVKRNTMDDISILIAQNNYIYSFTKYHFKNRYHSFRAKMALVPGRERLELLNLATVKLQYLLGGVHSSNDAEKADEMLSEFSALEDKLRDDVNFNYLVENYFYAIRNTRADTPAYLAKEELRQYILTKDRDPEILRTYLGDLDYLLRVGEVGQSEKVAREWLKQWKTGYQKENPEEFNRQSRVYHSIILAYINKVTQGFLTILDEAGDQRIENASNPEEMLFEIALERLDVGKRLVSVFRYPDAKTYLRTSYSSLNLAGKDTPAAARDIFIQEAALLGDRIAFAEQSLRGSAGLIDESKFREYLDTQDRDKTITERFIAFLYEAQKPEETQISYPTADDVADRFALHRITVLSQDIIGNTDFPFEFTIKTGRFIDRASDGSAIIFSGKFNYFTSAIYEITLNDRSYRGNYALYDFARFAIYEEDSIKAGNVPEPDASKLVDFLNLSDNEEILRSQVTAQDLAVQLMIRELESYNIFLSSAQQVETLNKATLAEFMITGAFIEEPVKKRKIQIDFKYNTVTKMASDVFARGDLATLTFPSQIQADKLIETVFKIIYEKEQEIAEVKKVVAEFSAMGLVLKETDIRFVLTDYTRVGFNQVRLKNMPIEFSGIYDRPGRIFTRAEHALLTSQNISVTDYLRQIAELWVIKYLADKGIAITSSNIQTALPADKVAIKNYVMGTRTLNFTFDVTANKLINISIEGLSTVVPSMTFDEFSLITAGSTDTSGTTQVAETGPEGTCLDFSSRLNSCVKYSCSFPDPSSGKTFMRRVSGIINNKCRYAEEMADGMAMVCDFSDEYRSAVAMQYTDLLSAGIVLTAMEAQRESGNQTYIIDGKEITNPLSEAFLSGECFITESGA